MDKRPNGKQQKAATDGGRKKPYVKPQVRKIDSQAARPGEEKGKIQDKR